MRSYPLKRLSLIFICIASLSVAAIASKNTEKIEFIEMDGITIKPRSTFNGKPDLFNVFDDQDNVNREEMNRFYEDIWPEDLK